MSRADEPIHDRLAELADLPPRGRIVDLGCGAGPTLAAFARRYPQADLTGLDRSEADLAAAATLLADHTGAVDLRSADLAGPIPLPDACADAVVSYNVLECLPDPAGLLDEVCRVLRPGGRAVLAHMDFDTLVVAGAPAELDRRVCHAYTDDAPPWMDRADGRMGRRLPGLVSGSRLADPRVDLLSTASNRLDGQAARRIGDIRQALGDASRQGRGRVGPDEVDAWHAALCAADADGTFFFAESAVIVVAHR